MQSEVAKMKIIYIELMAICDVEKVTKKEKKICCTFTPPLQGTLIDSYANEVKHEC